MRTRLPEEYEEFLRDLPVLGHPKIVINKCRKRLEALISRHRKPFAPGILILVTRDELLKS